MKESLDKNIKAILFDLDGTLLEINLDLFVSQYIKLWAQSVAHLISFNKFIVKVLKASKAVEENRGENSNEEVYFNAFFPIEGYTHEDLEPFFNTFYENGVSKLRQFAQRKPEARKAMQAAFKKGYDVVIATTPLLPAYVIEQRLKWAGVDDFPYRLITTIENSHATKSLSHLLYYEQILDKIGFPAECCLMVGDEAKDMIAACLGIRTFLVNSPYTDLGIDIPEPDYQGTLEDLNDLLLNTD